jgi:hypothetical protein
MMRDICTVRGMPTIHTIVWIVGWKRDERDDEEGWMSEREYGQRFRGAR